MKISTHTPSFQFPGFQNSSSQLSEHEKFLEKRIIFGGDIAPNKPVDSYVEKKKDKTKVTEKACNRRAALQEKVTEQLHKDNVAIEERAGSYDKKNVTNLKEINIPTEKSYKLLSYGGADLKLTKTQFDALAKGQTIDDGENDHTYDSNSFADAGNMGFLEGVEKGLPNLFRYMSGNNTLKNVLTRDANGDLRLTKQGLSILKKMMNDEERGYDNDSNTSSAVKAAGLSARDLVGASADLAGQKVDGLAQNAHQVETSLWDKISGIFDFSKWGDDWENSDQFDPVNKMLLGRTTEQFHFNALNLLQTEGLGDLSKSEMKELYKKLANLGADFREKDEENEGFWEGFMGMFSGEKHSQQVEAEDVNRGLAYVKSLVNIKEGYDTAGVLKAMAKKEAGNVFTQKEITEEIPKINAKLNTIAAHSKCIQNFLKKNSISNGGVGVNVVFENLVENDVDLPENTVETEFSKWKQTDQQKQYVNKSSSEITNTEIQIINHEAVPVGKPEVETSSSTENNGKSEVTTTTTTTTTNFDTGDVVEVTETTVNNVRTVKVTTKSERTKTVTTTTYTKNKKPVRIKMTLTGHSNIASWNHGNGLTGTLDALGSVNFVNPEEMAIGLGIKERFTSQNGHWFAEAGANVLAGLGGEISGGLTAKAGYQDKNIAAYISANPLVLSPLEGLVKNDFVSGEFIVKGEEWDTVVGARGAKSLTMALGMRRPRDYFGNQLAKIFEKAKKDSTARTEAKKAITTARTNLGIPGKEVSNEKIDRIIMDTVQKKYMEKISGTLTGFGVEVGASGAALFAELAFSPKVMQVSSDKNPFAMASLDDFMFEQKGANRRLYSSLTIDDMKNNNGDYTVFPEKIRKDLMGDSTLSQTNEKKIVVYGGGDIEGISPDGTVTFKQGVTPYAPRIITRLKYGGLEAEVFYGNKGIKNSGESSNIRYEGRITADGIEGLSKQKNPNAIKSTAEIKDTMDKIKKVKDNTLNKLREKGKENLNWKKISSIEESIGNIVSGNLSQKFLKKAKYDIKDNLKSLGIKFPKNLTADEILQGVVRARMEFMNHNEDGSYKKIFEQKKAKAKTGAFNTFLTNDLKLKDGFKPGNSDTPEKQMPTRAMGMVQGINGKPSFIKYGEGMTLLRPKTLDSPIEIGEVKYTVHMGYLKECRNASVFLEPLDGNSTKGGIMSGDTMTQDEYAVAVNSLRLALGATSYTPTISKNVSVVKTKKEKNDVRYYNEHSSSTAVKKKKVGDQTDSSSETIVTTNTVAVNIDSPTTTPPPASTPPIKSPNVEGPTSPSKSTLNSSIDKF